MPFHHNPDSPKQPESGFLPAQTLQLPPLMLLSLQPPERKLREKSLQAKCNKVQFVEASNLGALGVRASPPIGKGRDHQKLIAWSCGTLVAIGDAISAV